MKQNHTLFLVELNVRKMSSQESVLGLHGKVLVVEGLWGGFCENLPETSPVSDRANATWLRDGPTTAKGSQPISDIDKAPEIT